MNAVFSDAKCNLTENILCRSKPGLILINRRIHFSGPHKTSFMTNTGMTGNNTLATKKRYSDQELEEFRVLVQDRLSEAVTDYEMLRTSIAGDGNGTDDTSPSFRVTEDLSDVLSREEMAQLAIRRQKYIDQLKNALIRIQNRTYGICRVTGQLIAKERLRSVPHTTLSMDAKGQLAGL